MTDLLLVEKVDRDAAAELVRWQRNATAEWKGPDGGEAWQFFVPGFSRGIRQGIWDEHTLVQAFAAHRQAAERAQPATVASLYGYEAGLVEGFKQGIEAALAAVTDPFEHECLRALRDCIAGGSPKP